MGRFANGALTASACWAVAASIIAINAGTAYDTAMAHLPAGQQHLFWAGASAYLLFVGYLVAVPLGRSIRRLGSAWSPTASEEHLLGEARAAAAVAAEDGVGAAPELGQPLL